MRKDPLRHAWHALAIMSVLGLVGTACSSSKKSSSSGSTTTAASSGGPSTTAASSGQDIVIEGVNNVAAHPGEDLGFKARITRFNNAGGVQGRKVKFLGILDDGSDPAKDLTFVQQAVQKDHVFAVMQGSTVFLPASGTFLKQANVPVFGYGAVNDLCGSSTDWGFTGCLSAPKQNSTALLHMMEQAAGIKIADQKWAIEGISLAGAVSANKVYHTTFTSGGAQVVFDKNYTPYVQSVLASKPNIVWEVLDASNAVAFTAALRAAGYKGAVVNGVTYFPSTLASQPNVVAALEGTYIIQQAPVEEDGTPAITQEQNDLKAIGAPTDIDVGTTIGYWSADMLIQFLQATAAKGPITVQSLIDTVNAGVTIKPEMEGGNGPFSFPGAETASSPCAALVQVVSGKYVSKVKYSCYENVPVG
jgi:ABC-type branched-subunit amino acid transport system substrate-binding protein